MMKQPAIFFVSLFLLAPGVAGAQMNAQGPDKPFAARQLALKTELLAGASVQRQLEAARGSALKPELRGAALGEVRGALDSRQVSANLDRLFDGRAGGNGGASAVAAGNPKFPRGEWYFSWGYPRAYFTDSDIRFVRPGLGDDFTMHKAKAVDEPEWTTGIFNKPLTVPEYNWRLGYFFNKKKDLALELNFDHVKYHVSDGQTVRMTGKHGGQPVDQQIQLTEDVLEYELCDGANFLLLNIVKRLPLVGKPGETLSVAGIAKAGAGIVIPDSDNKVFGLANRHNADEGHKGYKISGWNTGVEAGLRFVPLKPFYLELTDKVDFADYTNVDINSGRAQQSFWTNEVILSLGVTINAGKKTR